MPFKSESQRRFMYAEHPALAKEFEAATPKGTVLPEKVKRARTKKTPAPKRRPWTGVGGPNWKSGRDIR